MPVLSTDTCTHMCISMIQTTHIVKRVIIVKKMQGSRVAKIILSQKQPLSLLPSLLGEPTLLSFFSLVLIHCKVFEQPQV